MAKTYVVKEKDNLASLSKALGVSIREIQQANGIRNLTPGQTLTVPASRSNGVGASGNAGGYSVTTGDNERKTINYNGTDIRLGPNSTFAPKNDKNKFKQFIDIITGNAPSQPGGFNGVRGSLPSTPKSIPGLASPTQYRQGLSASTSAGGLSTQFQNFMNIMSGQYSSTGYTQQAMAPSSLSGIPLQSNNPVTSSLVLGTNMPSYYQGPGQTGTGLGASSQIGGYQRRNDPYAPFFNNQQLGLPPSQFSYAPQGQPNSYTPYTVNPKPASQFSYAPQGQPNSYTPYNNMFPNLQLAPNRGNTGNIFTNQYVTPATGAGLGNTQPAFNQANFQSGANRGGGSKRWWIGRNRQDDGGAAAAAALAAQQAAELAANQAITMNPGSVQQATWRPVY